MRLVVLLVFSVCLHLGGEAAAQVERQEISVRWESGVPRVSFDASAIVDDHVRREIRSGLRRTVSMRVFAYRNSGGRPIALQEVQVHVTYDLWDERFRIQQEASQRREERNATTVRGVVERVFRVRDIPIGDAEDYADVQGAEIYFAVLVEFNPVSRATIERVRRMIARGGSANDEQVIGSFVSLFVNRRIGRADRVLRFRSRALRVPR